MEQWSKFQRESNYLLIVTIRTDIANSILLIYQSHLQIWCVLSIISSEPLQKYIFLVNKKVAIWLGLLAF
jgi:Na+-transporting NADH:ubiquinone oxidoreductase subunit NqrD